LLTGMKKKPMKKKQGNARLVTTTEMCEMGSSV